MEDKLYCEMCLHIVNEAVTMIQDKEKAPDEKKYYRFVHDVCTLSSIGHGDKYPYDSMELIDACHHFSGKFANEMGPWIKKMSKTEKSDEYRIMKMNQFCGWESTSRACHNVEREDPDGLQPLFAKIDF